MRLKSGTLAIALWSFGVNIALQKGWLDAVPNWAVLLMLGIPILIWGAIGLTHDRFRNYLKSTKPLIAMTVFILVGGLLGAAVGGVVFMLVKRASSEPAAMVGKTSPVAESNSPSPTSTPNPSESPLTVVRTQSVATPSAEAVEFALTILQYRYVRDKDELFAKVQFANNGAGRRTILSVRFYHREFEDETHPIIASLSEMYVDEDEAIYIEHDQPIVKTYRRKITPDCKKWLETPASFFGLDITSLSKEGVENHTSIDAMYVHPPLPGLPGPTGGYLSAASRNISLDKMYAYFPMEGYPAKPSNKNQSTPPFSPTPDKGVSPH